MSARFLRRAFPNANSVLLEGPQPVLVDSGAPGGEAGLLSWLGPRRPSLLLNTHWHSDHTGGNHLFHAQGVPIAAAAADAVMVNAGDPDACRSAWLRQTVSPYRVSRSIRPGDLIETGAVDWCVVALPGHTATQIGLFDPRGRTLVAGDAMHDADIGWLDLDADPRALEQAEATIEAVADMAPIRVLSGHGAAVTDVPAAIQRARRRLASWRAEPDRVAWHACKRILGHLLFTEHALAQDRVEPMLLEAPWLRDHARRAFGLSPEAFLPLLLAEMLRSGAAAWRDGHLVPGG